MSFEKRNKKALIRSSCYDEAGILEWVERKDWLLRLLNTPFDPLLHFRSGMCYIGDAAMPGITTIMEHTMFKKGPRKEASAKRSARVGNLVHKPRARRDVANERSGDTAAGIVQGNRVHHELSLATQYGVDNYKAHTDDGTVHPYTERVIQIIVANDWRLVRSEYIACDKLIGFSSFIDLIAVDKKGRLIFIELKTGYSGGQFERVTNRYVWHIHPFRDRVEFPCTMRNRAVIQIGMGAMMAAKHLGLPLKSFLAHVLQVEQGVIRLIPLRREFVQKDLVALYEQLELTNARTRKSWVVTERVKNASHAAAPSMSNIA